VKSAFLFLLALYVILLGASAYELIVLIGRLSFEASTVSDIIARPLMPLLIAAATA
jgi:hypothetical protein